MNDPLLSSASILFLASSHFFKLLFFIFIFVFCIIRIKNPLQPLHAL